MPLRRFETPLVIEPTPSSRLLAWVVLGHAAYIGLIFWARPSPAWLFAAAAVVTLSLLFVWRRHFFSGSATYIRRAIWNCDGNWLLECGDGRRAAVCLESSGICHPALIVLNFDLGRRRSRTLIVLSDSLPPEILRRLRVRLRQLRKL